jgi:hypothetical protein
METWEEVVSEILDKLDKVTPNQIDSYIDNNVTDLASAKDFLKRLTKIVALMAIESGMMHRHRRIG